MNSSWLAVNESDDRWTTAVKMMLAYADAKLHAKGRHGANDARPIGATFDLRYRAELLARIRDDGQL